MLPSWHAYERASEYFIFTCGVEQMYTSIRYLKVILYIRFYLVSITSLGKFMKYHCVTVVLKHWKVGKCEICRMYQVIHLALLLLTLIPFYFCFLLV